MQARPDKFPPPTQTDHRPDEPGWPRPGAPNGWRRGKVVRTLWPPAAGARRWLGLHGAQLVCVRHREDPLGLRRVVTIELVVAPVRAWRGNGPATALRPRAFYALRLPARQPALRRELQARGAWREPDTGLWRARGEVIDALGLNDWIISLEPLPTSQRRTGGP